MDEYKRQAYLSAMGIQTYFPRTRLAGAKASPPYPLAEAITPSRGLLANAEPGFQRGVNKTPADVEREAPRQQTDHGIIEQSKLESGEEAGNEEEPQAELKFELCYYKIDEALAVIDEIPHQCLGKSDIHAIHLLRAILLAVGVDANHCEFIPETFSWPLAAQLDMNNKPARAARKALLGFIRKRHEIDQFKNLLIFAGQIDELLTAKEGGQEQRDYQWPDCNYYVTTTTSLQSMLAYPLLKREVWQHLQPLRQRLASLSA